jgi:KDO2-lipid IV(A) lauroyltransferase
MTGRPRNRRRIRALDHVVYWLGRAAIGAAALVPQWLGYGAAALLGRLWFLLDRRRRRNGLQFLRFAFPALPARELARIGSAATANVFKVPIDVARITRVLAQGGDFRTVIDVTPALGVLPRHGRYLALTAHLGSWEMAAVAMAQLAGEAHGIARVFRNPLLQRWILQNRQRGGLHVHPRRGGIKELARAVERGAVGLQVVDQHQRLRGVVAPFFGQPASCERAAASLALRHGYPIVVGAALRVGLGFRFRLVGMPAFVPARTGARAGDLLATVTAINAHLETLIRMAPDQYLWIHDRFRADRAANDADGDAAFSGDESGDEAADTDRPADDGNP